MTEGVQMADEAGQEHRDQHPDTDEEQEVTGAIDGATARGGVRLRRGAVWLLATGAIAGIDVGIGVLAMLRVIEATGSDLLGALAFSIGFIAILLGRSELFTENFFIPVTAVLRRRHSFGALLRLWALTGLGNLAGGWVIMWIVVAGVPRIRESDVLVEVGGHFIEMGLTWELFASAVLGGTAITLMTWMEQGASTLGAKIVAVVAMAFVLTGIPLFHSVLSTLEAFGALHVDAPFGYLDWLGAFAVSVVGNIVGGVGLVTVLRLVQARGEQSQHGP